MPAIHVQKSGGSKLFTRKRHLRQVIILLYGEEKFYSGLEFLQSFFPSQFQLPETHSSNFVVSGSTCNYIGLHHGLISVRIKAFKLLQALEERLRTSNIL